MKYYYLKIKKNEYISLSHEKPKLKMGCHNSSNASTELTCLLVKFVIPNNQYLQVDTKLILGTYHSICLVRSSYGPVY